MNTSCDQTDALSLPQPETFVYEDVSRKVPLPPPTEAKSVPSPEEGPRISEQELQRLISEARADGKREGERQVSDVLEAQLVLERQRVATALVEFQQERTAYYAKVEAELVRLALAIAAKILHREAQVDRMLLAGLVKVMLEQMQQNTKVIVRVRPENGSAWRHHFNENANVQIEEDASLQPKDCVVVTELGTADMGLDAQLKEVEQGLFDLLAQRPDAQ